RSALRSAMRDSDKSPAHSDNRLPCKTDWRFRFRCAVANTPSWPVDSWRRFPVLVTTQAPVVSLRARDLTSSTHQRREIALPATLAHRGIDLRRSPPAQLPQCDDSIPRVSESFCKPLASD